ncbi:MAG: tannase/feruloyl esterase family alpha/beta hydrolase [Rhodospirillales bacterium]|nr:tannase/feruloyl esterase family alpha/beta hydrolase [Rhodospirillales bacterium]
MRGFLGGAVAVAALLALTAAAEAATAEATAAQARPMTCAEATSAALGLPGVEITGTTLAAPGADLPAHCVLRGRVDPRVGVDGRQYAIGFELRLPLLWNGRFLHQTNGGNDGEVVPAIGDPRELNAYGGRSALARGFAVLSSDEGHDGKDPANAGLGLASGAAFGLDPQARDDYGYAGDARIGPVGKAIVARFYGIAPAYAYMMGCSNGGRHAMVAASRFADRYDGFVAGDPGFDLPRAAIQHAWDVQSLHEVDPDIRKSFSPADMALVARKVLETCDALDGLADGMVNDIRACQQAFHPAGLQCSGARTDQCLSSAQVAALVRMAAGPHDSSGRQLYSDWPFDAGMAGRNWRFWKIESGIPPWHGNPLIATMGAASLAWIFSTPPVQTRGDPDSLLDFLLHFDVDRDAPRIYATGSAAVNGAPVAYRESSWGFMTPPDADDPKLAALRAAGHKLIVYHGQSDPVFSFNATARWYEKLAANAGGDASGFARLFAVPGMTHCAGGPATDRFDALGAMVDWVEHARAPDRLIATVSPGNKEIPANWSKTRTRPLCVWPKVARYVGGDAEHAGSFACR